MDYAWYQMQIRVRFYAKSVFLLMRLPLLLISATILAWFVLTQIQSPAFESSLRIVAFVLIITALLLSAWFHANRTFFNSLLIFMLPQPLESLLWFAASAASICIALIQHAYALAYMDELTGVPNRRALQEQLLHLSPPYAIAMVDIDHSLSG